MKKLLIVGLSLAMMQGMWAAEAENFQSKMEKAKFWVDRTKGGRFTEDSFREEHYHFGNLVNAAGEIKYMLPRVIEHYKDDQEIINYLREILEKALEKVEQYAFFDAQDNF